MNKTGQIIVYCTCPDGATAISIARTLVTEGLAACVNTVAAVQSVYRWKGKTESASENLLIIKTASDNYEKMERRIVELHPYELPEIIGVPIVAGLQSYLAWLENPEEK